MDAAAARDFTMDRRAFLGAGAAAVALASAGCAGLRPRTSAELLLGDAPGRPNVLWIFADDISPQLACYGEPLVRTPNLDRLARDGVVFENAFTTAPVCSASRSAIMTGMHQTSIGAHHHRSNRPPHGPPMALLQGVRPMTHLLRDAGYHTSLLNVDARAEGLGPIRPDAQSWCLPKQDYNFVTDEPVFQGSDWRQRPSGAPFYSEVTFFEPHRIFLPYQDASLLPPHPVDPANVALPPYYADTDTARRDFAHYLDDIMVLDHKVGQLLERLERDGLAESTLVIFMGDNGRPHLRGKQWLYDPGIHVPMIMRWPRGLRAGERVAAPVSAIDATATVLSLAGARPARLEGRPLLGPGAASRDHIVAARDRCDETRDRIRCVRTARHKYIRNFHPELPWDQPNEYKETQYPMLPEMRALHAQGKLTPAQARFFAPTKPPEELYDLATDRHEIHNLSNDPAHAGELRRLRGLLDAWIEETGDRGAIPEPTPA